ncbi:hypothetical protein VTP01DRAFT_9590 [Rhizomucor pusillus]|uniref:uncharacterized protein n=1 Tax=Rhizomucor pusillus TaxID=4840 RepID=UPI003741EAE6
MTEPSGPLRRRYLGGVCALIAVVIIWVASSFAMNSIFGEQNYNKPFLVTYLSTATFSFYLIPFLCLARRKDEFSPEEYAKLTLDTNTQLHTENRGQDNTSITDDVEEHGMENNNAPSGKLDKLGTRETIRLSLEFCILWFLANYTTNSSLAYTTVGSSTILSSTSGLFTLMIGSMFRVEKLTLTKVAAVLVSFLGVVLVSYSDQKDGEHDAEQPSVDTMEASAPLVGDLLALAGAVCYGCYTTLLKYRIGDESRINMPLFFGFVGAFNVVLLWPLFPILHWLGIETLQVPQGGILWATLLLNAFIGTFLSDYLWLLAMLMTSPLVVTLGISLTIPLALVGDVIFKHVIPGLFYAGGAVLVVLGFLAVNVAALSEVETSQAYAERTLVPQSDDEEQDTEHIETR